MRATVFMMVLACALCAGKPAHALRFIDGEYVFDKLEDYARCQDEDYDGAYCNDALDRWLKDHPQDQFAAAKLVRRHQNPGVAIPYFKSALDLGQGTCEDEDLALAVTGALSLPEKDAEVKVGAAREIALGPCFDKLKPALSEHLNDERVFANICKDLLDKNMLSNLQTKKCEALPQ